MKLTFLGTGTSTGVPELRCDCEVCRSTDPRDKRMRCSALVETDDARVLIDCGPDFYHQMLRAGQPRLDCLIVTHSHYDHLGGIDDLRPYCTAIPGGFPVYCREDVARDIRTRLPYCFGPHPYPRSPRFSLHEIEARKPFAVSPLTTVIPLAVNHNPSLPILGFRIGPLVYLTDCKIIPQGTLEAAKGCHTLVIGALRHKPHESHLNLDEALNVINYVKPKRAFLTHISHGMGLHARVNSMLPEGTELAFDGLTVNI